MKKIHLLIFLFTACGCSGKWVRYKSDAIQFSKSNVQCHKSSLIDFPIKNEVAQKSDYEIYEKKCDKRSYCNGDGSYTVKRPTIESYVIDVNEESRIDSYSSCMSANGWKKNIFNKSSLA